MILAKLNGERIYAEPKKSALCPFCNEEVISKCGRVKIWHWAHKNLEECDLWSEGESEWHLNWKDKFPKEQQEVIIEKEIQKTKEKRYKEFKKHIADIYLPHKMLVIELQNSSISPEIIIEREKFYENMIWLINGKSFCKGMQLRNKKGLITFRWKNPPKSWWFATKPIYIDFSDIQEEEWKNFSGNDYMGYPPSSKKVADEMKRDIFLIKKLHSNIPCGGYGVMITKEEFIEKYND